MRPRPGGVIAVGTGVLISLSHRKLYQEYYEKRGDIPVRPNQWLDRIEAIAEKVQAKTVIDYGCGPARSISGFSRLKVTDYDPGVPEIAHVPRRKADLVVSLHVLEHVEPDCIDAVIQHMLELARKAVFVVVSCEPSTKRLPDGSPWHSFVKDTDWWLAKLSMSNFEPQPTIKAPGLEFAALKLCQS